MLNQSNLKDKTFKIRGVMSSCVTCSPSLSQSVNSGFEKVVFKINLDKTGLENPNKWETCMLLNDKLAKPCNNCVFLNAMVTVEQWNFNTKDKYHNFELHQHTER